MQHIFALVTTNVLHGLNTGCPALRINRRKWIDWSVGPQKNLLLIAL